MRLAIRMRTSVSWVPQRRPSRHLHQTPRTLRSTARQKTGRTPAFRVWCRVLRELDRRTGCRYLARVHVPSAVPGSCPGHHLPRPAARSAGLGVHVEVIRQGQRHRAGPARYTPNSACSAARPGTAAVRRSARRRAWLSPYDPAFPCPHQPRQRQLPGRYGLGLFGRRSPAMPPITSGRRCWKSSIPTQAGCIAMRVILVTADQSRRGRTRRRRLINLGEVGRGGFFSQAAACREPVLLGHSIQFGQRHPASHAEHHRREGFGVDGEGHVRVRAQGSQPGGGSADVGGRDEGRHHQLPAGPVKPGRKDTGSAVGGDCRPAAPGWPESSRLATSLCNSLRSPPAVPRQGRCQSWSHRVPRSRHAQQVRLGRPSEPSATQGLPSCWRPFCPVTAPGLRSRCRTAVSMASSRWAARHCLITAWAAGIRPSAAKEGSLAVTARLPGKGPAGALRRATTGRVRARA